MSHNNRRNLVTLLAILAVIAYATRHFFTRPESESRPMRVAYTPVATCLPFFVAHSKGLIGDTKITLVPVRSSGDAMQRLISNQVDVVIQQNMSVVLSAWAETDASRDSSASLFRCFMPTMETEERSFDYVLVRADSQIRSAKDLHGTTIGIRPSPTDRLLARLYLEKHGMRLPQDVAFLELESNALSASLISNRISAAFNVDPDATMALHEYPNDLRVLKRFYRGELLSPFPATCNVVRADYLKSHRDSFRTLFRALKQANDLIESSPKEALTVLVHPEYTAIRNTNVAQTVGIPTFLSDYRPVQTQLEAAVTLYINGKILTRSPNMSNLFFSDI